MLINRSVWRNFPRISNERWVKDNIVLMGDAKATAHFSIGSGTKLAMEDACALFDSFHAVGGRDVAKALAHFETARREEVEKTQHAAEQGWKRGKLKTPSMILVEIQLAREKKSKYTIAN